MKKLLLLILVLTGSQLFAQRQVWENFSYNGVEHPFNTFDNTDPDHYTYDREGNAYFLGSGVFVRKRADKNDYFYLDKVMAQRNPMSFGSTNEVAFGAYAKEENKPVYYFIYFEGNDLYIYKDQDIYKDLGIDGYNYWQDDFLEVVQTDKYVWISQMSRILRFDKANKSFTFYPIADIDKKFDFPTAYLFGDDSSFVIALIGEMTGTEDIETAKFICSGYMYNENIDEWVLFSANDTLTRSYLEVAFNGEYDKLSKKAYLFGKSGVYECNGDGIIINPVTHQDMLGDIRKKIYFTEDLMMIIFDGGVIIKDKGKYETYLYSEDYMNEKISIMQSGLEAYMLDNGICIFAFHTMNWNTYYFSYYNGVLKYEGFLNSSLSNFIYKNYSGDVYQYSYVSEGESRKYVLSVRNASDTVIVGHLPKEFKGYREIKADSNYIWLLSNENPTSQYSVWRIPLYQPSISGQLYYDQNQNGEMDLDEVGFEALPVIIKPAGISIYPTSSGKFTFFCEPNKEYLLEIPGDTMLAYLSDPLPYSLLFDDSNQIGVTLKEVKPQIRSNFYLPWPRCNTVSSTRLRIENTGYVAAERVEISLISDGRSAIYSEETAFVNGDTLFFELTDLNAKKSQDLSYFIEWPDAMMMGETLTFKTEIKTYRKQQLVSVEQDSISTMLRCSYDPNDKSVMPAGVGVEKYTLKDADLQYLIRFENTGNDTAYHVTIYDTLDSNLNKSTFKILGSSHEVQAEIHPSGVAVFYFENIMLPDTNTNMEAAQGFVRFSISPAFGLDERTVISNTAGIVFDSNPAIITNTVHNTMVAEIPDIVTNIRKKDKLENQYYPNPASEHVYMIGMNTAHTEVYNSHGLLIIKTPEREVSVRDWPAGIYLFQSVDEKGEKTGSTRIMVY